MKTLPVIPVETLTAAPRPFTPPNGNPGIVPPWLQHPDRRNPGIVPPWLQGRPVGPTEPVADDVPRILGGAAAQPTVYEPLPINLDPETPRILVR